jgi:outer membrane protein, multidrug efflux system
MRSTMRRSLAAVALSMFFAVPSAFAQQRGRPQPTEDALPPPPEVNDPMLAPVAHATIEIATWEEALRHVRARSTDLRIAAAAILSAEAKQRVALAGALPSINGQLALTHNIITKDLTQPTGEITPAGIPVFETFTVPTANYLTGQLTAVQPLLALRAWHAIGTASVAADAARLSFDDAKRQIALAVANTIVGVVTAERIAELNRLALRNALQRVEITTRKATLGGATGLDVVRAKQDVEVTRATLVAGDETLRQARESLGLALGLSEGVGVSPDVDISGLERDARATCKPASKIDDRPDIAALRTKLEVAHRGVNDVKYQFAPVINLQSAALTDTRDQGAAPKTTWNVQAVLSVPLWEGGARYGNLRDANAQEDIAAQTLEATRRTATIQITQARRGVTVAEDSRRVAGSARDLAAETDRLTRLSYQEGRGTSLELVTAAQLLRQSEIQLALRDFELVKARVLAVLALASCPW